MVSDGGVARLMVGLTTTVANRLPVKMVILKKLASQKFAAEQPVNDSQANADDLKKFRSFV